MMEQKYEQYMHHCLDLAKIALAAGDSPVGAIIVLEGEVIGTGVESGRSTGDITDHAEIIAIRNAVKNGYADRLYLSIMVTTHEPCIMCSYVIRHHRIAEIAYGVAVPFVGGATSKFDVLTTTNVQKWGSIPKIVSGVCFTECKQLDEAFRNNIK
jgi:tRNA(adenine34) deaminase